MPRKTEMPKDVRRMTVEKPTYDTPIPDELRPAYESWYRQLPKNLQYTGDYDLQGAWLERLGQPEKYEATQNGHLDDYGKKPNHPTFSSGSKWHDPKVPERTGGEWKKMADGSWDFYPGPGNVLTDGQLKDYFDKYEKGNRVHLRNVRQAAKAGDAGRSKSSGVPSGHNPALDGYSGPRIVINPSTFRNEKDSLCVAFDEAFRIIQEINGFDPVAEPTEKQREFFSDTAYADDELQMRRTILARICTFDTSVTDPTDEQLQEAVEFLDTVLEIGAPQNQWEQRAVERIRTAISQALESGERVPTSQAPAPEDSPEVAAGGAGSSAGGVPKDEEKDSGAEFRENARAQMDEAAKLAQDGPTAEEQKTQAMAEAAGKVAGDDPFGKSEEMKAAAQEAGLKADIAEAQKPENLMQKNGHYVDAQGRVISERAARALAEQNVKNGILPQNDGAQSSPQNASEWIGLTSGVKAPGGRELTAGEAAWQERRQASTATWMQRTGRSGDGVADALAQRDERANNLRQVDSGRRDALGRMLDDKGRVIA